METRRKAVADKRRASKSIFDDEEEESDDEPRKVGNRKSRISSESSQSTSTVSREYVSRGIQNLSESSSSESDEEPPAKRQPNLNASSSGIGGESEESSDNEQVSEYFDFSDIISTQQKIKELEENKVLDNKQNDEKNLQSFCLSETRRSRSKKEKKLATPKVQKKDNKNEEVSELLKMGETNIVDSKDSDEEITSQENQQKEIEVKIDLPTFLGLDKKKKKFDVDAALKRRLNAKMRENQVLIHKVHLLCLLAHWNMVDDVLNSETILGSALSIVPNEKFYPPKLATLEYLEKLVAWFTKKVEILEKEQKNTTLIESLLVQFSECRANSIKDKVLMFVCVARVLGLKCRILVNLQPVPLKPHRDNLFKFEKKDKDENEESESSSDDEFTEVVDAKYKTPKNKNKKSNSEYFDGKSKSDTPKNSKSKPSTSKASTSKSSKKVKDRRVLSTESEDDDLIVKKKKKKPVEKSSEEKKKKKKGGNDVWSEVFLESEEKWISVDLQRGKIHCIDQIQSLCSSPICYVIGWNGNRTFKDLTKRYAPQWMTTTRKQRVELDWWDETIKPWKPKRTAKEKEEDYELDKLLEDKPLPGSIAEYKNHPLYVLKRHLLKFEAIYPPDAPPLGYVKGEPVYSRLCVAELHSRETWLRQAKSIRVNEKPYKIVKSRPKWDRLTKQVISDLPLEIFGHWQVEDYQPPVVVNGVIPRNDYGNVELYKPSMLPIGTVHLQIPGLLRVARKLKIDCAPALVGWEYNQGCSFPVMDGFIVCEEFKDQLLDEWNKSIDESAKREREKIETRVYGNWRKLIKGLIIRERLEKQYNFGPLKEPKEKKKPAKRKHK